VTPLDLIRTPLKGVSLIEAAAGTGKTFTIEGLYIRLVLEKQLPVEQILVVTFTRAATAELRDRIYQRLAKARDAFAGVPVADDDLLRHLVAGHPRPVQAGRLLRQALMDFDRAAIYTIHGFCQRILYDNAFETASAFHAELLRDPAAILVEVVQDFWRRWISDQTPEFLRFAKSALGGPEDLLELARKATAVDFAVTPRRDEPALRAETLGVFRRRWAELAERWSEGRDDVRRILMDAPLNGSRFGTLKPGEGGGISGRERMVRGLVEAMDAYCGLESFSFPPVAAVAKLSASNLARAALSRRPAPSHPVFDACDALHQAAQALVPEMTGQVHHLKSRLLDVVPGELERRKSEKGQVSFDDLLRRVARALETDRGGLLAGAVRRRYQAALVDEFQDTDDLQYAVFSRLFSSPPHLLFMIGDPKQAIYGFRGADIFSYLRAAQAADTRFTLTRNWRSAPGLVQAVNTLFSQSTAPFLFPGIGFVPGRAARSGARTIAATPPMIVWHLDSRRYRDDGQPLTKLQAQSLVARAVTAEVQRLGAAAPAGVRTGDMAVLVRTNQQAALMKDHLSAAGVPSVIYSTADVFDTIDARELLAVLAGLAEPQSTSKLKTALATHILGVSAGEIAAGDRADAIWEPRIRRHWEYFRLWNERGFACMFRQFLSGEAVKQRLLSRPDGERRLTNLLHLAELAHRAALEECLGPAALVTWLTRRIDPRTPRSEETQLRLESDELAVKIVTVHRSKGLEYPVVFCPFAWSGSSLSGGDVFFHDPERGDRLTADISGDTDSPHRVHAQNEVLAENLRMLYVAVTRARERCYLAWGRINTAETSALAYLLRSGASAADTGGGSDWVARLRDEYHSIGDDAMRRRLLELAAASAGAIAIQPLPDRPETTIRHFERPALPLAGREFRGTIAPPRSVTSYSALAAAGPAETPDRDGGYPTPTGEGMAENRCPAADNGIADFPAGARAGTFFHAVFETLDFTQPDSRTVVSRKLQEFGFDSSWTEPVCRMVAEVLAIPLFQSASAPHLAEVGRDRRVSEMEFCFPLNRVTPELLEAIFAQHRTPARGGGALTADGMERLHFAPTHGFMKGFIDLVFEHNGRYYLVDWKSNRLGASPEAYGPDSLRSAMREHHYDLQVHIYTLALHQYLRLRVPAYEYDRDFGGACYVFLRGVSRERGPDYGIFCSRPEPQLVHALGEALIPDYA
jgi:exodeoxyribonuclease V beta subunit